VKRLAAFLLIPLASMVAAPGAAGAEPARLPPLPPPKLLTQVGAPVPLKRTFVSGFTIDTHRGYRVGVQTFGGAVMLIVYREGRGRTVVETAYLAKGVANPDRLQATFGQFGKVLMRFREAKGRPWRGKRRDCRGRDRYLKRRGVFVGNLRFRGEDGYLSLRAHRARGTVETIAGKCLARARAEQRMSGREQRDSIVPFIFDPSAALFAGAQDGVDSTSLIVLQHDTRSLVMVNAEESRGRLAILRYAFGFTPKALEVDGALTRARLKLPAPFHGAGRYRAAADGTSTWTGDLSVHFPGAPRFPLTGPRFETFLELPF
jgi:hypothetical protein